MGLINSLLNLISRARAVLPAACRGPFRSLVALMGLSALLESLATVSLGPFLALATHPERVWQRTAFRDPLQAVGIDSNEELIAAGGIALVLCTLLVNSGKAWILRRRLQFDDELTRRMSTDVFERYLTQPYEFYTFRNRADLKRFVTQECVFLVQHVFEPLLTIIDRLMVAAILCLIIAVLDPFTALVIALSLSSIYLLIHRINRPQLNRLGRAMKRAKRESFRYVDEILNAIKLVKLAGVEQQTLDAYDRQIGKFTDSKAKVAIRGAMPRFVLEVAGIIAIVSVTIGAALQPGGLQAALPLLGIYAFAFYRLLPSFQLIFLKGAKLLAARPHLEAFAEELSTYPSFLERLTPTLPDGPPRFDLECDEAVRLSDVSYHYPQAERGSLNQVSLVIPRHSTVGIVGTTGSGKTTLLNVILGLLTPQQGRVIAFGRELTPESVCHWQRLIGFVPQDVVLLDATVAENIAFGCARHEIDMARVEEVARIARIDDFILGLPDGFNTRSGDNGIRFSGGQRQRIAIARALYRDPPILVFDEATSSLDSATELEILAAMECLQGSRTMIVVAHRPSTIERCTTLFRLENGRLQDQQSGLVTS